MKPGETLIRRGVLRAIRAVQAAIDVPTLRDVYATGDPAAVLGVVPWDTLGARVLVEDLLAGLRASYLRAARQTSAGVVVARKRKPSTRATLHSPIFIEGPEVGAWLNTHGARQVVQISQSVRDGLRQTVEAAYDLGLPALDAAQWIRPQVGLFDRWQSAVTNRARQMREEGASARAVQREVERYSHELRNARSLMIARTEASLAATEGRFEAARQASEDDWFDAGDATWEWDASPNACEVCAPMDGVSADYRQPSWEVTLTNGDTMTVTRPPESHPNCTCDMRLVLA